MRTNPACSTSASIFRSDCLYRSQILVFALSAIVMSCATTNAIAQKPQIIVDERTLKTEDQLDLKITYYRSSAGKEAKESPVIVLLHGAKGNRHNWKNIAPEIHDAGFAVVAVDLRGHGENPSKGPKRIDYQAMAVHDLEAVKAFLYDEHQKTNLNMNKLGIVGCDFSASVAMFYAEFDWMKEPHEDSPTFEQRTPRGQDVQALVLISPDTTTPGLFAAQKANSLRQFEKIAVMIATSKKNSRDFAMSKKLFEQLSSKRVKSDRTLLVDYPEDLTGINLVQQDPKLKSDTIEFLVKYVKQSEGQWHDRRSRLERE